MLGSFSYKIMEGCDNMTIYGMDFIYSGESSQEYGVKLGFINSMDRGSNEEPVNIIFTKNLFKEEQNFHGAYPSEPLSFKITVFNEDGSMIDADKQEDIKCWLCRNEFGWLSIDQDDLMNKFFYCIINTINGEDVGMQNAGFTFQVTNISPWAYSEIKTKTYTSTTTLTDKFYNSAKFYKYILYPQLTLTANSSGNISIKNNTTNKTMIINNCLSSEKIYIDCKNDKIDSSTNRILLDDFNKTFIGFVKGSNSITLTGNFTMLMQYRIPVRIGG
jgi:hypothetical protein